MVRGKDTLFHSLRRQVSSWFVDPMEPVKEKMRTMGMRRLMQLRVLFDRSLAGENMFAVCIAHMHGKERNTLNVTGRYPSFIGMKRRPIWFMSEAIRSTREDTHTIFSVSWSQNFALIAGCAIEAVCDWYLSVYADAYEWVELQYFGMALFADGGVMASKPYCSVASILIG